MQVQDECEEMKLVTIPPKPSPAPSNALSKAHDYTGSIGTTPSLTFDEYWNKFGEQLLWNSWAEKYGEYMESSPIAPAACLEQVLVDCPTLTPAGKVYMRCTLWG